MEVTMSGWHTIHGYMPPPTVARVRLDLMINEINSKLESKT